MARKLFDGGISEPISPLIDIVINALAAIFTILMIYIVVVQPAKHDALAFVPTSHAPTLVRGRPFSHTPPVVGGQGSRHFVLDTGAPPWLAIEATTGTLHGTPPAGASVETEEVDAIVRVRAGDESAMLALRLRVEPSWIPLPASVPELSTVRVERRLPAGWVGMPYEAVIGVRGGVPPHVWHRASGHLPAGLTLRDGRLVGVPETAGQYTFTAEVSYGGGTFRLGEVTRTWTSGTRRDEFTATILPRMAHRLVMPIARVGEPYLGALATLAKPPDMQIEWAFPDVAGVSRDGVFLEGTPRRAGQYLVSYTLLLDGEVEGSGQADLQVLPARPTLRIESRHIVGEVGQDIDEPLGYSGASEPVAVGLSGARPTWLRLEGNRLRGRPDQPGTTRIEVEVLDALGRRASGHVTLEARRARPALAVRMPTRTIAELGRPFTLPLSAQGAHAYIWTAEGLPPGITVDGDRLVGEPTEAGTWRARLIVEDPLEDRQQTAKMAIVVSTAETTAATLAQPARARFVTGVAVEHAIAIQGGVGGVSAIGESPAPGLSVRGGQIAGTPTVAGTWTLPVTLRDAAGVETGPFDYAVEVVEVVAAPPDEPTICVALPTGTRGEPYRVDLAALDGSGLTIAASRGLPSGLAAEGGVLSGVPTESGLFDLKLTLLDEAGTPRMITTRLIIDPRAPGSTPLWPLLAGLGIFAGLVWRGTC